MSVAVFGLVWLLWPVFAFAGGLALAPLNALAGLLLAPLAILRGALRARWYMAPLAAFLVFAAASALWSPRPFTLIELNIAEGDVNLRSEVARVGLGLIASGLLIAAIQTLQPQRARWLYVMAALAIAVQFIVVGLLAAFEQQALDLFAPMMSAEAEGVQNITRNALLLAAGMPVLLYFVGSGSVAVAILLMLGALAAWFVLGADAGLLASAVSLVCVGIVRIWPASGFRILSVLIALGLMTMPALAWLLGRGATQAEAESSLDWRLLIWNRVLQEIESSPWWGGGIGVLRTIDETISAGPLAGGMLVPNHSHNMAMQLWAETGAIGAGLLSMAIILAGWRLPPPSSLGPRGIAVAALVGAAGTIGAVSFDLWNEWWWSAIALLAAATLALCRSPERVAPVGRGIVFGGDRGSGAP